MASIIRNGKSSLFKSIVRSQNKRYQTRTQFTDSQIKSLLTKSEAVQFLEEKLHIPEVKTKARKDRLGLLSEITFNFNRYIPFHNLTLLNVAPKERRIPSLETVRKSILKGEGGLSYPLALCSNSILSALGYKSYLVLCKVRSQSSTFTHVASITKDVHHIGDCYYVDFAAGFPTFEPVPLHDLPRKYKQTFSEYRFVKRENRYFRQYRLRNEGFFARIISTQDQAGWELFYTFVDKPRTLEEVKKYLEKIYTQPGYGDEWYLMTLKMSIYPKGKAVTLSNRTLRVWDVETKTITMTSLPDNTAIKEAIREHFPMLDHIDVDSVLKNWQQEVEEWKTLKE